VAITCYKVSSHNFSGGTEGKPPIQWVPEALSPGLKWLEREDDHSKPSSTDVKNAWSCASIPQYVFMARCFIT